MLPGKTETWWRFIQQGMECRN